MVQRPKSERRREAPFTLGDGFSPECRWICGLHPQENGQVAAVWIAHDKDVDCLHLRDEFLSHRDLAVVQAEAVTKRGPWIPVAWPLEQKEFVDLLIEHGVNAVPAKYAPKNVDAIAESVSLDIHERMETGRFKVDKRMKNWLEEYDTFQRQDSRVPKDTHPLQAATRHAVRMLDWACTKPKKVKTNTPRLAIV